MNKKQQKEVDSLIRYFEKKGQIVARWYTSLEIFEYAVIQYKEKKKRNVSATARSVDELQILFKYYLSFNCLSICWMNIYKNEWLQAIKDLKECRQIKELHLSYVPYCDGSIHLEEINVTKHLIVDHSSDLTNRYFNIYLPKVECVTLDNLEYYNRVEISKKTKSIEFGFSKGAIKDQSYTNDIPIITYDEYEDLQLSEIVLSKSELTDVPCWLTNLPRLEKLRIGNRSFPLSKVASIRESLPHCNIQFN
jgi:hypothetical protein